MLCHGHGVTVVQGIQWRAITGFTSLSTTPSVAQMRSAKSGVSIDALPLEIMLAVFKLLDLQSRLNCTRVSTVRPAYSHVMSSIRANRPVTTRHNCQGWSVSFSILI